MVTPVVRARAVAVAPLLVGLFFGGYALGSLPVGSVTRPGPGLWPIVVSAVVVVMSLLLVFTERTGRDYEPFTARIRQVAAAIAVTSCFVWAFTQAGLVLPALAFLVVWLRFFGKESWRTTFVVAVLTTAVFHLLFVTLLAVPLPEDVVFVLIPG